MRYDYQFHINGLKGIKPYLQSLMLTTNYEGMGGTDAKEIGETIDLAIEALEKQIPKKPTYRDEKFLGKSCKKPYCPTCDDSWNGDEFGEGMKFCWECGQAIDWSDAE